MLTLSLWYYGLMQSVQVIPLTPKVKKDNGLFILDTDALPFPASFSKKESGAVYIPAGQTAGNHRHPRQEAFVCFQKDVELHWIDADGTKQMRQLADNGSPMFVVSSMVPHAVVNKSGIAACLLYFGDGPLLNAETMEVV